MRRLLACSEDPEAAVRAAALEALAVVRGRVGAHVMMALLAAAGASANTLGLLAQGFAQASPPSLDASGCLPQPPPLPPQQQQQMNAYDLQLDWGVPGAAVPSTPVQQRPQYSSSWKDRRASRPGMQA